MIKISKQVLLQIQAQKNNVRLQNFMKFSQQTQTYFKLVVIFIFVLILIRAIRAYVMYMVVDNFLQTEYQESYNTWKAMSTDYTTMFSSNVRQEE